MAISRAVYVLLVLLTTITASSIAHDTRQNTTADCVATLDGATFPFLVPDYVVWEQMFSRSQVPDAASGLPEVAVELQLSEPAGKALASISAAALKRADAVRTAPRRQSGLPPEAMAADLVLEARDDMLRMLSRVDFDRVTEHMEGRRRQARYTFPKPGKRATNENQIFKCPVSINGREHPELIPEAFFWEFHLTVLASVSADHRTGPNTFATPYISTLRQIELPIPEPDVITLLNHAASTAATIESVRNTSLGIYGRGEEREAAVARAVQAARLQLLLRLPKSSWMIVNRHAKSRRGGIVYHFPTSF